MKVLDRQQLASALFEPRRAGCALALWAMAIAAGTIRDRAVAATVALLDVATERGGATDCDVASIAWVNFTFSSLLFVIQRFPIVAKGTEAAAGNPPHL